MQRIEYPTLYRIRRLRENLRVNANSSLGLLASLKEKGIEDVYIELLKEIYTNYLTIVHISTRWGVRQGYTISPKLFMTAFETIFRRLTLETRGLKIDGEYISRAQWLRGIASDSRLREPGFESCAAVLKTLGKFVLLYIATVHSAV